MDNVLHPYGTNAGREHEHKQTWRRLNVTESEVIPGNMNVELIPKERAISPASIWFCKEKSLIKGPYRCYYKSLSFVSIGHTSYMNLIHFPQNSFIYEKHVCLHFCPYSVNITKSTWKCATKLFKKNFYFKSSIAARKAAIEKNYFSGIITLVSTPPARTRQPS